MRVIPTGAHGVVDYLMAVVLVGAPYVLGFGLNPETGLAVNNAAIYVPVTLGFALILYSLLTNYELGVVRRIPMRVHLGLDAPPPGRSSPSRPGCSASPPSSGYPTSSSA